MVNDEMMDRSLPRHQSAHQVYRFNYVAKVLRMLGCLAI